MEKQKNESKVNFFLGFFAGLAVISMIGFFVLLAMVISGGESTTGVVQAGNDDSNLVIDNTDTADQPQNVVAVKPISDDDYVKGDPNADVQLIIYDDFECPYCLNHEATVNKIVDEYGDKVAIAFRHFPLSFHPNAQKAAEAYECGAEQGKFWEMKNKLFDLNESGTMSVANYKKAAVELKLNTSQFNTCLDSGQYASKIASQQQDAITFGVEGTPGNFLNGQLVSGALPFEQFKPVIDQILAQ
ncbi:hypothetical protein A2533_00495 [Candidatus Falkowbacteria bacterium RIFOXYD2_FULL_35_9]|uniref:Thioredoxin domain-containing protein n=1 Tax=Candidatus Falkowbacteria bacterium RIFOXYC2_FULL_36_12 TaxID=1798002 RepID=A0A1F5T059_9BACT|nr:MAG: hypothetical protein A2478_03170 [Candidatus Falkowbacteria bacterium RIFOXYC2_FULL_36_12]OGF46647.1 MAG: hypothetical protein A2533_00495 [Candidatus Falkowbacteria bacterium RIFOXYD2_FULL_35_9]